MKNNETELAIFQQISPLQIFKENKADDFLSGVEKEVEEFKKTRDISTPKGRTAIKSFSYKISQTKAPVDKAGLNLTEEARDRINKINTERKRVRERLQSFQDDVRQPLTDYENKEKERIEVRRDRIQLMDSLMKLGNDWSQDEVLNFLDELKRLYDFDWAEFQGKADNVRRQQVLIFNLRLNTLEKEEQEQAELEKLRKEKEAGDQKDRDEKLKKEEAEKVRREEHEKADKLAKEEEDKRFKLEAEKKAAELAKINAEIRVKEGAKIARAAKEQAKIQAERDKEEAVRAEGLRIKAEGQKEIEAEKAREADIEHRTKINNEAAEGIAKGLQYKDGGHMPHEVALTYAKIALTAIVNGKVPHVSIKY